MLSVVKVFSEKDIYDLILKINDNLTKTDGGTGFLAVLSTGEDFSKGD